MKKGALDKLNNFKESVILATVSAKDYQKVNILIVKHLTKEVGIPGVYVTLNKPFHIVKEIFKKAGVNTDTLLFIDAITKTVGGDIKKTKECLFIGSPENLSDLSLSMDQAVSSLPSKDKFLFFDSLNTLLIYNDIKTVARFIHFLAGKMRVWKVKGIIISLQKKGNEDLINELTQFCDIGIDL